MNGIKSQNIGAPNTILAEEIAAILIAVLFPLLLEDILKEKNKIELIELGAKSVVIE